MGLTSQTSGLSLGEGSTPLVPAGRLSLGAGYDLHLKLEGANPTGSFKDRGMVVAVARAVEAGARAVVCASTGNTAASAAAYAARAGLDAVVLTPAGATATAKRAQAVVAGARLIELSGSFDDCLRICRELGARPGFVLVNSLNPDRIEGQKSVVGELLDLKPPWREKSRPSLRTANLRNHFSPTAARRRTKQPSLPPGATQARPRSSRCGTPITADRRWPWL